MADVGQLTVNLGLNAAGFSGGITEAGKAARKAGQEIKAGMEEGKYSMMEARHAIMMIGEEFGIHIPRGVSTMIASLGPVGTVLAAAFPFAAIALGATLVFKEIAKVREEAVKLGDAESEFAVKGADAFSSLDEKLNQTMIKSDELHGNLQDKLSREIDSINHATLKDIASQFDSFDKSATGVFEHLKASWYNAGTGSAGMIASLDKFKNKYQELLTLKDGGVAAEKFLEDSLNRERGIYDDMEASRAAGAGASDKEFEAQKRLAQILYEQVQWVKQRKEEEAVQTENKGLEAEHKNVAEALAVIKARADGDLAHLNALHEATKEEQAAANAQTMKTGLPQEKEQVSFSSADLEFQHATAVANKKMDLAKIVHDNDVYEAGDDAQKKEEADQKYTNAVRDHQDSLNSALLGFDKARAQAIAASNDEQSKNNKKIAEEKLALIEKELSAEKRKDAEVLAAQKTSLAGAKEVDEAQASAQMEHIKTLESLHQLTTKQALQAEIEADKRALASKVDTIKAEMALEQEAVRQQIALNAAAAAASAKLGTPQGNEKAAQLTAENTALQAKLDAAGVKAQDDIQAAQIKTGATIQKLNGDIQASSASWRQWALSGSKDVHSLGDLVNQTAKNMQQELNQAIAGFSNAIAKTIVEGKNLGQAMKNVAKEMAESFISSTVQMLIHYLMMKVGMGAIDKAQKATETTAALAADKIKVISAAGVAGAEGTASFAGAPWPIDMGAPAFGATMTAAALSFGAAEQGGLVGYDDMIIAAHKNEMVLPAHLSEKVQNMTDDRKTGNVTVNYAPTVHAIDGKGMTQALNEHSDLIQAHVQKAIRKTNR